MITLVVVLSKKQVRLLFYNVLKEHWSLLRSITRNIRCCLTVDVILSRLKQHVEHFSMCLVACLT